MARLLVVGSDGLVGADLVRRLRRRGHDVVASSRRAGHGDIRIDLTSPPPAVPAVDVAIICAAVARIDQCAADPRGSRMVNVHGTLALARKLMAAGAGVVFLSTDKVTDGRRARASRRLPARPLTEYGRQKAEAERRLLALPGAVAVLRLSKVLDASLPLLRGWAAKLTSGESIEAFADMYLAPVDLPRVAYLAEALALTSARGIFHLTGAVDRPYAELARLLADAVNAPRDLVRMVDADPERQPPAARPRHSSLEMSLERRFFGLPQPDFATVVTAVTRELKAMG